MRERAFPSVGLAAGCERKRRFLLANRVAGLAGGAPSDAGRRAGGVSLLDAGLRPMRSVFSRSRPSRRSRRGGADGGCATQRTARVLSMPGVSPRVGRIGARARRRPRTCVADRFRGHRSVSELPATGSGRLVRGRTSLRSGGSTRPPLWSAIAKMPGQESGDHE